MALPDDLDHEKLAEVALAILSLTQHTTGPQQRVWKGLDWDLMELLHQQGWISDPRSKAKSVALTPEGEDVCGEFLRRHFSTSA